MEWIPGKEQEMARSDLRGLPSKIAWASIRAAGLGENPHSS
jgi:hypothetical protein